MFCVNCGEKIAEGSNFCAHCGSKQDVVFRQDNTLNMKEKVELAMGEIYIYPEKPKGVLKAEYFIYVDDMMYKWSSKNNSPIVVKTTPEIHIVHVSRYKIDTKNKYASFGKMAGEVGSSGVLGAAGAIVGLSANLASTITSGILKSEEDVCAVDLTGGKTVTVKVTMNLMGKMKVWEE